MSYDGTALALGHGLAFADLYDRDGLARLDAAFLASLEPSLANRLQDQRAAPEAGTPRERSALVLALARPVETFLADLFGIAPAVEACATACRDLDPLFACRKLFVHKVALRAHDAAAAAAFDGPALRAAVEAHLGQPVDDLVFARAVLAWMEDPEAQAEALDLAARYAAWAVHTAEGRTAHGGTVLFRQGEQHDPLDLVPLRVEGEGAGRRLAHPGPCRDRDGFDLTDDGCDLRGALGEVHYCIFCHRQGNATCTMGLRNRETGAVKTSPLGRLMEGCPLDENVSEMNEALTNGWLVGALACVTAGNPLCAGTGHRICNDCMVSCVYQNRQRDPVDIPQAETRVLKEVLALPWGFEIYSLLTRWNPLNFERPVPRPATGRKVLVVGLGPAGYTLAHHLLNDGHAVVAIDGLKIEPLEPALSGVTALGERVPFRPVRDLAELWEDLGSRVMAGFGGVAEYGITVRWDKNFLKVLRLLIERRKDFAIIGGVRFGGTLTEDTAFALGFDHVAFCMGAGKPTIIPLENGLARGVRQASDFLMALQLTGAARRHGLANLQVRLPAVVIGGGLTGIDCCTELAAYYPLQVERFLDRHEALVADYGEAAVRARWTEEDAETAAIFLEHGRAVRAERAAAAREGRPPALRALVDAWGGVTLVYRRQLTESPAYRNVHEEIGKALEEGIYIAEGLTPKRVNLDRWGWAESLDVVPRDGGAVDTIAARMVIIAAGTVPNTTIARETPGGMALDGAFFQAVDEAGRPVTPEAGVKKPEAPAILREVFADGRAVSFFGDQHPSWAGNVVSAMASAKRGYPVLSRLLARRPDGGVPPAALIAKVNDGLRPVVHAVRRLTPTIVEVVIRAPMAARMFRPGQFFRLQNFETLARRTPDGTPLAMEGVALTGAWTDPAQGLIGLIVLDMGGSSTLCAHLQPGEPVVLMGPTGKPTEIPSGETVLLAGGGLGNAVLFSIGQALRAAGSRVVYFAAYKSGLDRFRVADVEAAADVVVWCCDAAPGFQPGRPGDKAFVGNIVEAMAAYGAGALGDTDLPLSAVDRLIAIGSDRMMQAVGKARHGVLKPYLKDDVLGIGSINSPMQCMMKEICAQCLQPQTDPKTGETRIVFTCFDQDQPLDWVDFGVLHDRLRQNSLLEKQTALWIDRGLRAVGLRGG
jgi:NADPH-dependent glutamate synthase beta subunit-like oxidoreductase/NAD(P)H-flavin reductase